jgi:hypothetical protein
MKQQRCDSVGGLFVTSVSSAPRWKTALTIGSRLPASAIQYHWSRKRVGVLAEDYSRTRSRSEGEEAE